MGRLISIAVLTVVASLAAAACDENPSTTGPSTTGSLFGSEWVLVELGGQPVAGAAMTSLPTLVLDADTTRAAGFAGCNRFTTSYTIGAAELRFGNIAATRMFCADTMTLEDRYLAALGGTRSFRVTGGRLDLLGDTGVTARFELR
jgi:heat shock protein HslJ